MENSAKIMAILKTLHNEGKTVILVTHDEQDAKIAQRIITLQDGKIISDNNLSGNN